MNLFMKDYLNRLIKIIYDIRQLLQSPQKYYRQSQLIKTQPQYEPHW